MEKLLDDNATKIPRYLIDRDVMTQEVVIKQSGYDARDKSLLYALRQGCRQYNALNVLKGLVPILDWLPRYSVKKYLIGDIMSGATVAVMHIPQGMAYGILAGLTPNVGLYMAFFPVLAYFVFGTSRHISIGTFAVVSMMTLKVVQTYSVPVYSTAEETSPPETNFTALEVATATATMVGFLQILMGIMHLGILANLLSEPLVNGFTTAAAVHVIVSQIKDMFGLSVKRYKGAFKLIYTVIDIFKSITSTNVAALIFSAVIIIFMALMNELVKPWMAKKTRFPLPAELIAVVGGTLISRFAEIGPKYNVQLVGEIPTGLPAPRFPPIELFSLIWFDAIVIAVVTYSVVMSMAYILAKKHSYEISANQELFALGCANILGGSFSCIPAACSLSRSLIQEQTGGMTQIASVISASFIVIILLWIGPYFQTLPRCVLAGIIVVALKGMFMQAKSVKRFAKEGKLELLMWICTFITVVLIDIDFGLLAGILISIITLYIKGWKSNSYLLGTVPETGLYVDLKNHKNAVEIPMTKIFRYEGSLNYGTQTSYKKSLYDLIQVSAEKVRRASITTTLDSNSTSEHGLLNNFKVLILDFSAVAHIDIAACKGLTEVLKEMKVLGVRVYLAGPSSRVYDTLVHSMAMGEGPFEMFPSVHDAVLYSKSWRLA